MEDKINSERKKDSIQVKRTVVNNVKNQFFNVIKRKIGDLLVNEISKVMGDNELGKNLVFIKLPHFLKPIFSFYDDDQLLIETSLLFIIYSLNLMNNEMQVLYGKKIAKIEQRKSFLLEMKNLLKITPSNIPEFVCKFTIPQYILPKFSILEQDFENLVSFGLIKIFEWLNVLTIKESSDYLRYEQSFAELIQNISQSS